MCACLSSCTKNFLALFRKVCIEKGTFKVLVLNSDAVLCLSVVWWNGSINEKNIRFISWLQIEQKVSLESLTKLKMAFEVWWIKYFHIVCNIFALQKNWHGCLFRQEFEKAGTRFLDLRHFRLVIKKCLGLRAIVSPSAITAEWWYHCHKVIFFYVYANENSILVNMTKHFGLYLLSHSLDPLTPLKMPQNDAQIRELFMKIDYSGRGSIGWVWILQNYLYTSHISLNSQRRDIFT